MAKITNPDAKVINTIKRAFQSYDEMSFSQLLQVTRLDSISLRQGLTLLKATEENGFWALSSDRPSISVIPEADKSLINTDQEINSPVKRARSKPFTPNPIMGYQVQVGKAKIFLDRRASSRTLTLSLKDLKELVNAVEKAERIA